MLNVLKINNFTKLAKQNDQEIDFGVGGGRKRGGGVGGEAEGGGVRGGGKGRKQILPLYLSRL